MAFSFGGSSGSVLGGGAAGGVSQGPDLQIIQTEGLGFLSIASDAKVRLTSPWSPLPAPTASLISIASRKGLVAAAGPDGIALATTEAVRKAFEAPKDGDSDVRAFTPQLKIPMPMRVSQLAFTADESYLILSAEVGGGLAVYDVQTLLQGSSQSAFELPTNGESLRTLVPNPTSEKAELCAIVTSNGNLHMANLKERRISNPLQAQVSCISWSNKGKQLVAGLADGTIRQMTPEGDAKDQVPKPQGLNNYHVASLAWLENNAFLAIYVSTSESPPSSVYNIITRQAQAQGPSTFTFQKIADPVDPFGAEKVPHHSILRLKDFPPNLQDLLIVSSTATIDIGLLTRSKSPLDVDKKDNITDVFTTTELADDSKRASLPMSEEMDNTVPIGIALDLSSKDKVYKPIPTDEIEESPGPVPGFWVLNHEGVLCAWWIIYTESIRQGTTYPGMAALQGAAQPAAATPSSGHPNAFASSTQSVFGSSPASKPAFGAPSALGGSSTTFGAPSALGGSTAPAFGGASALGAKASPWGSSTSTATPATTGGSVFGQSTFSSSPSSTAPAFGKPSSLAFGQSASLGTRSSPWTSGGNSSGPAFGQSGFVGLGTGKSVFGSSTTAPTTTPASGGFASFATQGGFAALGSGSSGGSVFGSSKPDQSKSVFGSQPSDISMDTDTAFPAPKQDSSVAGGSIFGSSQPFKLGTTFKADPSAKDDAKPATGAATGGSMFGTSFGLTLNETAKQPAVAKDQDMDTAEANSQPTQPAQPAQPTPAKSPFSALASTTPTTSPAPAKFTLGTSPAPSVFGFPSTSTPKSNLFGTPAPSSGLSSIFKVPETASPADRTKSVFATPEVKIEPEERSLSDIPLPPETTSRDDYPLGQSSSSSAGADQSFSQIKTPTKGTDAAKPAAAPSPPDFTTPEAAPLPPDFTKTPKPIKGSDSLPSGLDAPLPPDFTKLPKLAATDAPLPPDFTKLPKLTTATDAPLPPDFTKLPKLADNSVKSTEEASRVSVFPSLGRTKLPSAAPGSSFSTSMPSKDSAGFVIPKLPSKESSDIPSAPDSVDDSDLESDEGSEGTGVDVEKVLKEMSPSSTGLTQTPGFTPQSSFAGMSGSTFSTARPEQDRSRPALFGEITRNAPVFGQPSYPVSPRSPSPVRGAVPSRVLRPESSRSVSAPGMASQILGTKKTQPQPQPRLQGSIMGREAPTEDPFVVQQRKAKQKQEAEEMQPLIDEEDEEIQRLLAAPIEGALELDEFVAHANVIPAAKDSIPSQVEAVYRDVNSMIDTLGLNARSLMQFVKGHSEQYKETGHHKEDLDNPDDWVLCEIDDLGEILEQELAEDLEEGRVQDLEGKMDACHELSRDMIRLRSKQEDLKRLIFAKLDPGQAEVTKSLPLSAEQATQQTELRREFANFSRLLAETEEALTILKARIASANASSGVGARGGTNVPTVDAVMRTITKMTSMAEKRSGDVDVLENQMRKLRFSSVNSREGSPLVTTPQKGGANYNGRSSIFSLPDTSAFAESVRTPPRGGVNSRHSLASSVTSLGGYKGTPPRKKMSGFTKEQKSELMERRARRQGVLNKLKTSVENNGIKVWSMEDIE